ncbi:hypothetical protein GJ496_003360 [Pomphorhynchus laevis]|nr:hypothetical protein GJ496_003360 [Pomphorhynchus laevis]
MDKDDRIEREVRHCREELNRRTSGLVQAREDAELSIRKYRDEVEKILHSSYGSKRSQNRSLDMRSTPSGRQILSEARLRKSSIEHFDQSDGRFPLFSLMSFGNFLQAVVFGLLIGLLMIYVRLKFPEWQKMYWSKGLHCDGSNLTSCKYTINIVNKLFDELSERTGRMVCESLSSDRKLMSKLELETFLLTNRFLGQSTIQERVDELLSLIMLNPSWNIKVMDNKKNALILEKREDALNASKNIVYLYTDLATKPFICRLEIAFWKVATLSAIILSALVLVIAILYLYKMYKDKADLFSRDCFEMIDKITDLLISQKQEHVRDRNILPYMAVSHIHDTLIPLSKRNRLEKVWDRAREIIGKWESRVRQENQLIDGEEYVVWRWLGPLPGSRPNTDTED